LKFLGFNFSITQAAVVFPFIIQAQRFFTKQISLGDLIQTAQAFGRLQENLSFFRNAYDSFASYRATLDRLTGFTSAIDESYALPHPNVQTQGARIAVNNLTIKTPAGLVLIEKLNLEMQAGAPLLIRGSSGAGKTTLLRAIAGLWPYCEGTIVRPEHGALFLSQKPYIPLGSLRDALYYPSPVPVPAATSAATSSSVSATVAAGAAIGAQTLADPFRAMLPSSPSRAEEVLKKVQLGHLTERLDEVTDWGRILSLGEQQRLAFGRLLLAKPAAAFLDEASSAMDEGLEDAMYRLARESLPNTLLISVGHRSSLLAHHPRQLTLKGKGAWELSSSAKP
ncbi:MAG: ATP-binding cassette domain-containing protein, partial [Burkholderiaceae bacterium]